MAGALQLIARLQAAPVPPVPPRVFVGEPLEAAPLLAVPPVPLVPPRTEQHQQAGNTTHTPGHAIDNTTSTSTSTSATASERRSAWAVMRGGRLCCQLVGEPMTRAEALAAARWRWPDADIQDD